MLFKVTCVVSSSPRVSMGGLHMGESFSVTVTVRETCILFARVTAKAKILAAIPDDGWTAYVSSLEILEEKT